MTVYLWKIADECPARLIGSFEKSTTFDRLIFKGGKRIGQLAEVPAVKFAAKASELAGLDDLPNNGLVPLVSDRLAKALAEACPDHVEFFDSIVEAAGVRLEGFKVLNATSVVRATDRTRSDFTMIPGTKMILGFKKLVVVERCISDGAIARDEEYLSNLLLGESVASLLARFNLKWTCLYRPEEMRW